MDEVVAGSEVVEPIVNQDAQVNEEEVRSAYDRIANPNKAEEVEATPTVETPPETAFTAEQGRDLMAQVSRIPELEKRLRDDGGRYGALKQQMEQLQQRITTSHTTGDAAANAADASELLADLREEFPELADKLQGAFSKVMSNRGGQIDPSGIDKIVSARLQAERNSQIEEAKQELSEAHPDWQEVIAAPTYQEWRNTLSARENARIAKSHDPLFAAEMLDKHKNWLTSKATQQTPPAAPAPQPSKRLANAVLPTNGTRQAPKGEPDAKESIRAGYERVAGARR